MTVDLSLFDNNPGEHNFTVVVISTLGERAEYTYFFNISGNSQLYELLFR